jgi:hypothetical protein
MAETRFLERVALRVSTPMAKALAEQAAAREMTPSDLVRVAIARELGLEIGNSTPAGS